MDADSASAPSTRNEDGSEPRSAADGATSENRTGWRVDAQNVDRGTTDTSAKALRAVVRQAALGVSGSVEHTSGLNRITGRSYPRVEVTQGHDRVAAEVHIAAVWPSSVTPLAAAVRGAVVKVLRAHTGATSVQADVHVGAVVPGSSRLDTVDLPLPAPSTDPSITPVPAHTPAPRHPRTPEVHHSPASARASSDIAIARHPAVRSPAVPDPVRVRGVSTPRPAAVRAPASPRSTEVRAPASPRSTEVRIPTAPERRPVTRPAVTPTGVTRDRAHDGRSQ